MGTYRIGLDEIKLKLMRMLDELEGEIYEKDFKKACREIVYGHWSE